MSLFADPSPPTDAPAASTPPETDGQTDGLTTPQHAQTCLGHDTIQSRLLSLCNDNKLPHGLVFSGIKGIGKSTLAFILAKYLLSQPVSDPNQGGMFGDDLPAAPAPTTLNSDPENKNVRLFLAGAHPDCIIVERPYDDIKKKTKDHIDIAQIRTIEPFLRKTSSNGGWRIVIVDDADTMNRNAQNALLKILEEPPKKTVIILIAHRFGALIPTIKSRTQHIHFNPLDTATIRSLQNQANMPSLPAILIQMAEGSFGRLQHLTEEGGEDTLQTVLSTLQHYPKWDWPAFHKTADSLSRMGQDQAYNMFHSVLQQLLWILTQHKARNAALPPDLLRNAGIERLFTHNTLEQFIEKSDALRTHFNRSDFANLDKKTTLLQAINLISA